MPATSITIIVSPYHMGVHDYRVGGGPLRILAHGIAPELERFAPVSFINIGPVDEFEGEMGRALEVMRRISKAVSDAVAGDSFPLVLSGNCNASAAVAAGLSSTVPDLNFCWIDAHDDLDTPSIHENGYLDAMAASMMGGLSWQRLMQSVPGHKPVDLKDRGLWCGLRDVSELQKDNIRDVGVDVVWGGSSKGNYTAEIAAALDRRQFQRTHIHLDLDVLDESLGRVNDYPSPGGFLASDLLGVMPMLPTRTIPTSLVVCSFNPRLEGGDTVARLAVRGISLFVQTLMDRKILVPQ